MKKILELSNIKKLSKSDQQSITGAWNRRVYCGGPRRCCFRLPNGAEFCDYGYCQSNGNCIWA